MKTFSFLEWLEEGGAKGLRSFALDKSYERISWVYSCINRISTTASSAPLVFYRGDKSDAIRGDDSHNRITDENDPVYHLFHPPNPPDIPSLKELISRTFIHLGVDGLLFWVFVRKKGVLVDIEIKAKNELRPVLSEGMSGELIGWAEFGANGQVEKTYPVNEVLPIRYYNPKDPLGGLSPLLAARLSLESEFNIAGWNSSFFKSGMKSPLLMKSKGTMTKDQKKELKGEIINYYSGIEGGHGALLVQGGVEVEPLSISPKDIDFINGKKLNREEICAIFGIPPALVGIFEYANYSNVREQIRIFWELTLLPKLGSILDLIQVNILDTEFPGVYAKWDLSEVHGLKRDPADVADAVKKYRESGLPFKQIAILLNLPQLEPDGSWDLEPVQPTRPPAPQQLPDGDEEDEPQEEALVLMPKTNWLEDYNSRDLAQTDLLCKDVENALEQFGASIYSVYKRGSALRREFWINFWDDLVGKSLRHVFGTSYKDAVWCVARSTNGTKQKLLIAGELKDLVYAEVNGYIQGTKTIPNSLVSFLANNEIAAWSNYLSYQRDMAGILVAGVREQTRYHVFARTGVKKQVWVCRDDLHQHLHNSELNGDGIYPHSSKLLPRDIVGCTCTTMPIEFS